MPKGQMVLPASIGSSVYKSAATAIVWQETIGALTYIIAVDGTTHAVISWALQGTADDVVINAALTYVAALGGGEIYMDRGIYVVVASITFPGNDLTLRGTGRDTFLNGEGLASTEHAIMISGRTDCTIRDLAIQAGAASGSANICAIWIEDGSHRFRVEGVTLVDYNNHGIELDGTDINGGWIVGNTSITGQNAAVWVVMDSGQRWYYGQVKDNLVLATRGSTCIDAQDFNSCTIEGNILMNSGRWRCIALFSDCDYNVIADNFCYNSYDDGIYLSSADYNLITGNYVYSAGDSGILLRSTALGNMVIANYLIDNNLYGVEIEDAAVNRTHVKHNYYQGNGSGCISDAGTDTAVHEVNIPSPNPNAYIGDHATMQMLDTVPTTVRMEVPTLAEVQGLVTGHIVVVPAGTGNLYWMAESDYGKICSDQAYNTHSGSIDFAAQAVTQNELECLDITSILTNLGLSDWVGVKFHRAGQDGLDTVGATVHLMGLRLRYV